jgi:hypothetical protein
VRQSDHQSGLCGLCAPRRSGQVLIRKGHRGETIETVVMAIYVRTMTFP